MPLDPAGDLAKHSRFFAEYERPAQNRCLPFRRQRSIREPGADAIVLIVAHECQHDGYIKSGKIVRTRPPSVEELSEMYGKRN